MSETARHARWPWVALGVFFSFAVVGLILVAVNGESLAEQIPYVIAFTLFGVVGALLLSRLRGNRIGGLLLYGAAITGASFAASELATYLAERGHLDSPLVIVASLVSSIGWLMGIFPVILFLPLLFPDGHLPSRRWLPFAWLSVAVLVFLGLSLVLGEKSLYGSGDDAIVANPFYVPAIGGLDVSDAVFSISLIGLLLASVTSLVLRFRRSRGVERQQIKWVALALGFLVASFLLSTIASGIGLDETLIDTIVSGLAFIALPVSVAIAVLQYHLYDLDVVVKKALVAGALVLLVIAAYAAVVGLLGVVTSGNESSGSVFVVALVLGLAFRPVTRFARRIADRIVYGRRATPYEVLTEFSERVGESYATGRRPRPDGADPRPGHGRRLGSCLAAHRHRAAPGGLVADGRRARGCRGRRERRPADDRGRDRRRGSRPGRAPRGHLGRHATQRPDEPLEGTPGPRPRVPGGRWSFGTSV